MVKFVLFFVSVWHVALYGAAFSPSIDPSRLEAEIEKAIRAGSPVAGIVENLEELAIRYDAQGDALGQLLTLRRISELKGISKDKKMINDVRVGNMFKELEKRLKVQAGQSADMRQHYQAQIMLGRLYMQRNEPGDAERASSLFKLASVQKEYPELKSLAYLALGDLSAGLHDPKSTAYAMEYYRLVPEGDAAWSLAQAKLGVLLMHQDAESAKEILANGVSALGDRSFSMRDRTRAKMLAAENLKFQQNWQEAVKYLLQVADETLSDKERLQANMESAVMLQRTQPLLAPIYFKRVYDAPPVKDMEPASWMLAHVIAAKELAALELERLQKPGDVITYVRAALDGVRELIDLLVKNKALLNNTPGVVSNFLTGGYGLDTVIRNAENKVGASKLDANAVAKLRADLERLDQELDDIEDKKGMKL